MTLLVRECRPGLVGADVSAVAWQGERPLARVEHDSRWASASSSRPGLSGGARTSSSAPPVKIGTNRREGQSPASP